jgi:integrase
MGAGETIVQAAERVDCDAARRLAACEGVRRVRPRLRPPPLPRCGGAGRAARLGRGRTGADRLLHEVDEQRNPKTRATVDQLLDHYLETLDVEPTTRTRYEGIIRIHLRPALGRRPLSKLDSDLLDRFFGQLRRCRERCKGRTKHVRHRTQREHECDGQCVVVPCRPLSASSVRQTHWVLNAALSGAVRWRWIGQNPLEANSPPPPPASNPSPPSAHEASRLLEEAFGTDR